MVTKTVPRYVDVPTPYPVEKVVERRIEVPYDVCVPLLVACGIQAVYERRW